MQNHFFWKNQLIQKSTHQQLLLFIQTLVKNQYIHGNLNRNILITGYLLRVPLKRIQRCILETLYKVIQPPNKSRIVENNYDGLQPATAEYLLEMQCVSDLCETLVQVEIKQHRNFLI